MRLYIAEFVGNQYTIGVFSTLEKAKNACKNVVGGVDINWLPPHPEDESEQWVSYHHGVYIAGYYLDNEFTD